MAEPSEFYCASHDGALRIFGRAYGPVNAARTIICLHGLTRNSSDFDALARRLAAGGDRVLAFDQRGRGRSQWDPEPKNYIPLAYCQDMLAAMDQLGIARAVLIGTSMGGLMSMMMAAMAPQRVIGFAINDVGPEIDPRGIERIRGYVGKRGAPQSWEEAAQIIAQDNAVAFPDFKLEDWLAMAHRAYVQNPEGRFAVAYDPAISQGLTPSDTTAVPPDLWPMWDALKAFPILAIRGELSDLLAQETLVKMAERHPGLQTVVVPRVGHAPMLDEPVALAAIDRFLASLPPEQSA